MQIAEKKPEGVGSHEQGARVKATGSYAVRIRAGKWVVNSRFGCYIRRSTQRSEREINSKQTHTLCTAKAR